MPISLIGRLTDGISIPTETLAIISQLMGRKKLLIGRKLALPISLIGNLNFVINIPVLTFLLFGVMCVFPKNNLNEIVNFSHSVYTLEYLFSYFVHKVREGAHVVA